MSKAFFQVNLGLLACSSLSRRSSACRRARFCDRSFRFQMFVVDDEPRTFGGSRTPLLVVVLVLAAHVRRSRRTVFWRQNLNFSSNQAYQNEIQILNNYHSTLESLSPSVFQLCLNQFI